MMDRLENLPAGVTGAPARAKVTKTDHDRIIHPTVRWLRASRFCCATTAFCVVGCMARVPAKGSACQEAVRPPVPASERTSALRQPDSYASEAASGPFWAEGMDPEDRLRAEGHLTADVGSGAVRAVPADGWDKEPPGPALTLRASHKHP